MISAWKAIFMHEVIAYFRQKKNLTNLLILLVLLVGIPIGVDLAQKQQVLKSNAATDPIVFTGPNVVINAKNQKVLVKPQADIQLTSTLGPPKPIGGPDGGSCGVRTPQACTDSTGKSGTYWCSSDLSCGCYSLPTGGELNKCNTSPPPTAPPTTPPSSSPAPSGISNAEVLTLAGHVLVLGPVGSGANGGRATYANALLYDADAAIHAACDSVGKPGAACQPRTLEHFRGFDTDNPSDDLYNTEVMTMDGRVWVFGKVGSGPNNTRKVFFNGGLLHDADPTIGAICDSLGLSGAKCQPDVISHFRDFDTSDPNADYYNTEVITFGPKVWVLGKAGTAPNNTRKILANGPLLYDADSGIKAVCDTAGKPGAACQPTTISHFRQFDTNNPTDDFYNTEVVTMDGRVWVLGKAGSGPNNTRKIYINGSLLHDADGAIGSWCDSFGKSGTACQPLTLGHFRGFDADPISMGGGNIFTNLLSKIPVSQVAAQSGSCTLGGQSPATTDSCSSCLTQNVAGLRGAYDGVGFNSCSSTQIVNHWCNNTDLGTQGACSSAKSGVCASSCSSGGPNPTANPTAGPTVYTMSFKLAEDDEGLKTAPSQAYTSEPTIVPHTFKDSTIGLKNIVVEFTDSNGKKEVRRAQIMYAGPDPVISSVDCNLDVQSGAVRFKITGEHFGTSAGQVTGYNAIATTSISNLSLEDKWSDTKLTALFQNPSVRNDLGAVFWVSVIRSDGQKIAESCKLGVSQLSLGTRFFCRATNPADISNVDLTIIENTPGAKALKTKVTIQKDGKIQVKERLQEGRSYSISVKAPLSLRRVATVTAAQGTTVLNSFVLPLGDMSTPVDQFGGLSRIDTSDYSELKRQFGKNCLGGAGSTDKASLTADLWPDCKVNTIDYACLVQDFGKVDEVEPTAPTSSSTDNSSAGSSSTVPNCTHVSCGEPPAGCIFKDRLLDSCEVSKPATCGVLSCAGASPSP